MLFAEVPGLGSQELGVWGARATCRAQRWKSGFGNESG